MINTFSIAILPLLWKYNIQLPIVQPSDEFMKKIIKKINHEQIISLRIKADHFKRTMELANSDTFTNIKSLTFDNLQKLMQIYGIRKYFPRPTSLSLHYTGEIDFHKVCKIFNLIPDSVQRLKIHCGSINCSHDYLKLLFTGIDNFNTIIKYFTLHVGHTSWSLVNHCVQGHKKCILRTITDFIRIMFNIQHVCVIVNKGNVETWLDVNEWTGLVDKCRQLEKITLKVIRNVSNGTQLIEKIQEIEDSLHNKRDSIKFQVKVK